MAKPSRGDAASGGTKSPATLLQVAHGEEARRHTAAGTWTYKCRGFALGRGFAGEFLVMLDGETMGDKDCLPCLFCDLRFKSFKELVEHIIKKHKGERVHFCVLHCSVCYIPI